MILKNSKSVEYSSQGSHTGKLDWQIAVRRDNVITTKSQKIFGMVSDENFLMMEYNNFKDYLHRNIDQHIRMIERLYKIVLTRIFTLIM